MIILHGSPNNKEVALLFDDGPNPLVTPELLKILEAKQVPANFFLIGMRAEQSPEIVQHIVAAGHEIGNHTYTHKRLTQILTEQGEQAVIDEVVRGRQAIENASGIPKNQIRFLRPPYLDWNEEVANIVQPIYGDNIMMSGLAVGDWDWGVDEVWSKADIAAIGAQASRIVEAWKQTTNNGTLLGFHDGAQHNLPGNKQRNSWMNRALPTLEAMPRLIDFLADQGFTIKRLSDMDLALEDYVRN